MSDYLKSSAQLDPVSHMGRRSLLIGLGAGALGATGMAGRAMAATPVPVLPVPPNGALAFRIMRNGSVIGKHSLTFRQNGDTLLVEVAVEILVKFGPIPVYRYVHRASETLRDGVLIAADGKTNDDGKARSMTARLESEGLVVNGSLSGRYVAPPGTMMANHWNKDELKGPMVNPQGGKLLRPVVTPGPEEAIALASGKTVEAKRFNLSGDARLDLWYDRDNVWASTRFSPEDGSEVLYERI